MGQLLEPDRPEGGGEVLGDVVAVAGHGRRLEGEGLVLDPGGEIVGEGLAVVAVDAGAFAGQDPVQSAAGGGLGGEAAAAQGLSSPVEAGEIDSEGPPSVTALRKGGAACADLAASGVAAAATAVDTSSVGVPAHRRSLRPAGPWWSGSDRSLRRVATTLRPRARVPQVDAAAFVASSLMSSGHPRLTSSRSRVRARVMF
jgi:hypothetical protein